MDTTVSFVYPSEVMGVWKNVEKYLYAANKYGDDRTPMHIWLSKILAGSADLFVASDMSGAAVCEVLVYPNKKTYLIALYGGNKKNHEIFKAEITKAAKTLCCSQLEIRGRLGWEKLFKSWGWRFLCSQWAADL